jgi:hypothetical protein
MGRILREPVDEESVVGDIQRGLELDGVRTGPGDLELDGNRPADHTGWRLQSQTNPPNAGLTTNWSDIPGSSATNMFVFPIDHTKGSVFYRMIYP